ncbi:Cloroperoxidase [Teratosphaeria nubilosa]|uniref:Cloroperoxidase n=1 Tax=Teratosphaeria nubilosa TaxID=161662 RepID=A0A6G1L368_9PEZI|nr:Cloroperoxidase [Teratosphaeria nubilosa]
MYTLLANLLVCTGIFGSQARALSSLHTPGHAHHAHHEKRIFINSFSKPVDISGEHAFQAPGAGDQRGPCPGLNALANHGYIPRHGVVSLLGADSAINEVYGVSVELATILAVMGVVWTGNPISLNPSFSIGDADPQAQNLLGNVLGLLGSPRGLDHSHNFIEADSSPTRDDLYVTTDPVTMNLTTFEQLYDMVPENSGRTFTLDVMADFAKKRWDHSIATNPYFYYGPVTGTIARNTGFCFVKNLMANYSAEHPEGVLSKSEAPQSFQIVLLTPEAHDILKSFYGVTGERANFKYDKGHERIPENWYKTGLDYGLVQLNLDILHFILKYPIFASIGGNMGEVNSFTGVDLQDPVSGALNIGNILENNYLLCFALEVFNFAAPNYLNNIVATLEPVLKLVTDTVAGAVLNMSCPQIGEITRDGVPLWESLGNEFPGAKKSGSAL